MELLHSYVSALVGDGIDEAFVRRHVTLRPVYNARREVVDYFIIVWTTHGTDNVTFRQPFEWDAICAALHRAKKNSS
jgi:hypothetical protein